MWLLLLTILCFYFASRVQALSARSFTWLMILILLPLFYFKYSFFLLSNVFALFGKVPEIGLKPHLPLGISFITFTVIAYLVNVRRGIFSPEKSFAGTALYISFFPHLIAGPIMRPHELFPQFKHLVFKKRNIKFGLLLFAVGMIKKVVFADQISPYVDQLFTGAAAGHFLLNLFAAYAFTLQIYCDFSGYTDMALGLALVLGIRLPLNFNRPYLSESIRDFWRRWHMTLSRWFRDYVYIPLGGSKKSALQTSTFLMITMLIAGLWHGASWTFVLWGGYYGILLIIEHAWGRKIDAHWPVALKRLVTFHLIVFGWILFRAQTWGQFTVFMQGFFVPTQDLLFYQSLYFPLSLMLLFFVLHYFDRASLVCWVSKRLGSVHLYSIVLVTILTCLAFSVGNPSAFIYFDF